MERIGIAAALPSVQRVRAMLVAQGWLDKSQKQRKIVRSADGAVAVLLPVISSVDATELAEAGIAEPVEALPPAENRASTGNTPAAKLRSELVAALRRLEVPEEEHPSLLAEVPSKWERHGSLVLLPSAAFTSAQWNAVLERPLASSEVWAAVGRGLAADKVARKAAIDPGLRRESTVSLLLGDDGVVQHVDNGVTYEYDATKCMFSSGNITEKLRVAGFRCAGEVVVDLYAGIGYFTLQYLVKAKAAYVHACEWNPHAAAALRRNLELNRVEDRCTVYEGDNAVVAPKDVADRVNLGLIPSSEPGWAVGCASLKTASGGWLHVHDNVEVMPGSVSQADSFRTRGTHIAERLDELMRAAHGGEWVCSLRHIERVKSYAPRIFHVVFDVEVRPL